MKSVESILLCLSIGIYGSFAQSVSNRTAPVALGNGTSVVGVQLVNYDAFYGIPFAQPPVGKLRFANPVRNTLPSGEFQAVTVPPQCPQPDASDPTGQRVAGSEDCLYLNIYRPNTNTARSNYDIMFFIHGGAFYVGSSNPLIYNPNYLMDNGNVILVTIQYRLNTLGFLSTGDSASPGNFAMKDQTMALRWIRENIRAFGGNPDSITISGQSAGSGSVHMLTLSPLSRDLFKAAIAFSASAIGPWNYPTVDPLGLARNHSRLLNITNANQLSTTELVEELRKIPAEEIIRTVPLMKWMGVDPVTLYRVVVEPNNTQDAFLTESPLDALRGGRVARVPTMFSVVPNEGALRAVPLANTPMQREAFNNDTDNLIPFLMELVPGRAPQNFTQQIKERYSLTQGISGNDSEVGLQRLYTDRWFFYPAYQTLLYHLNASNAPLFFYNFTYRGQYSFADIYPGGLGRDYGVVHGDDLIYLFDSSATFPGGLNSEDQRASREYVDHVVQFVRNQTVAEGESAQCMDVMCNYLRFFMNETGSFDREVRSDFDMDMVRFWDQTNEINL